MGVSVCLPLFGNPGRELEETKKVKGDDLRKLSQTLNERLTQAAEVLDKLMADGWTAEAAMFDLMLAHRRVETAEQAVSRVRNLGIDPELLLIVEDIEEEDD